jgi:hypothetical protein
MAIDTVQNRMTYECYFNKTTQDDTAIITSTIIVI